MYQNIPNEMKGYRQWVVWRLEWHRDDLNHEKKPTKIPYSLNGNLADVTNHNTWHSFDELSWAKLTSNNPVNPDAPVSETGFSGIGFVLTENDPYAFIDLDDTHSEEPDLSPEIKAFREEALARQVKIFQEFDSYSERSPSRTGLHIIVKGSVPKGRRRAFVELYSDKRYMTMTGDVFKQTPINDRQELVTMLWNQLGPNVVELEAYDGNSPQKEDDEVILTRGRNALNGSKFADLFEGRWKDHYGSHSEADFALIDMLAFYTQNIDQIYRLFRQSVLGQREKAKRFDGYIKPMIVRSFDKLLPPINITGMQEQLQFQLDQAAQRKAEANKPQSFAEAQKIEFEQPQLTLPGMPTVVRYDHLSNPPPGLMGDIASFIYRSAPTPVPEIALTGAIGLMAGIGGRCYNIGGAGLNQYVLCLAPTGSGKEAIATGISKLMASIKFVAPTSGEFIGPGNIRSDAALLKWISKHPCFVSIVGEFGLKLKQISSQTANSNETGLRGMFLDLYNKSGKDKVYNPLAYSDTDKNTAVIVNPAFTMLGESTPETFYSALDESMITEGLLPRFTVLEYDGQQPPLNKGHEHVVPNLQLVDRLGSYAAMCTSLNHDHKVINVRMTNEAEKLQDEIREFARSQTNTADREIVRHLWSRVAVKVSKLAALVAVGVNPFEPTITKDNIEWAKSLIVSDVLNILKRFKQGEVGRVNEETKQERLIKRAAHDYLSKSYDDVSSYCQGKDAIALHGGRVVTYTFLSRKVSATAAFRHDPRGVTTAIQRTIANLIAADVFREVPAAELKVFGTRQKGYMVNDWSALTDN